MSLAHSPNSVLRGSPNSRVLLATVVAGFFTGPTAVVKVRVGKEGAGASERGGADFVGEFDVALDMKLAGRGGFFQLSDGISNAGLVHKMFTPGDDEGNADFGEGTVSSIFSGKFVVDMKGEYIMTRGHVVFEMVARGFLYAACNRRATAAGRAVTLGSYEAATRGYKFERAVTEFSFLN